ncbi:MAG: EAL domain-containing protein, partial [Wenzhouxiangellaceae bacterium]
LRFEFISDRAQQLFGVSREELEADFFAVFRHFHPDDVEWVKALNAKARRAGTSFQATTRMIRHGQTSWIHIQSRPRAVGTCRRWAGIVTDVTEQVKTEQELAESERLLASMSRLSGTGGWQLDLGSGDVRWTQQTFVIHDLPSGQPLNLEHALSFYQPDDRRCLEQALERAVRHAEPFDLTLRITSASGREVITRSLGEPVVKDGEVVQLIGAFQDITRQAENQRRLAEAEARFRTLFEQSPLSIMVHDARTGAIFDANRAAWQAYGLDSLEALKERYLWSEPPYSEAEAVERVRAAAEGRAQTFEWLSIDCSGRRFRELVTLMPVVIDGQPRVLSSAIDITELHGIRQRFQAIFDASPVAITVLDITTGELLEANAHAWRSWGFDSLEDMLNHAGRIWLDVPFDRNAALAHIREAVARGGDRFEWPTRRVDGSVMWNEVSISPLDVDGRECALVVAVDVTIRRQGERLLRESDERFRALLKDVPGVAIQGFGLDGTVNYWNRASEALYGYSEEEALGRDVLELVVPPELRESVRAAIDGVAEGGSLDHGETEMMRKDGTRVPVYSSQTAVRREGFPTEVFCIDIDLSERKRHEDELMRIASYDTLTGLPNRTLLAQLMREQCARADESGQGFAFCYLDLDEFKPINDQFGHTFGDRVLVMIAERLRGLVHGSDVVGRLGGDEFVLLLGGIDQGPELDRRLRGILDRICEPIWIDARTVQVAASIGVTLYPADSADPDILLRHADQAMYRAKAQGRKGYSLFDLALEGAQQRRLERLQEIEEALRQNQFVLYFHPKISLRTGEVRGVEGLVRWQHPVRGLLPPAEFLADLEQSELEYAFGDYVIERALEQLGSWAAQGLALPVSVNISAPHLLAPDFLEKLASALERHPQVPPSLFRLEILETAAVADRSQAVAVLDRVRRLEVGVSLDDFGTGYSSLRHLRSLPVDEVKIDQSFVRDMLTDPADHHIVRSVLGLAAAFELHVVAEGVETLEHMSALTELDCELGQGYVFALPMPAEDLLQWLADWPDRSAGIPWSKSSAAR